MPIGYGIACQVHERSTEAGGSAPPVPRGRAIGPAPFLRHTIVSNGFFSHVSEGYEKKQHHGPNENRKKAWLEINFRQRLFCCFPRMLCIRLAAFRRRPVCGSAAAHSQYCHLLLPRDFCVFRGGKTTIPQALRASFLYTREPFLLVSSGNCLPDKMSKFRYWVQG